MDIIRKSCIKKGSGGKVEEPNNCSSSKVKLCSVAAACTSSQAAGLRRIPNQPCITEFFKPVLPRLDENPPTPSPAAYESAAAQPKSVLFDTDSIENKRSKCFKKKNCVIL